MIKFTASQAELYRRLINISAEALQDDIAAEVPMLFERWQPQTTYSEIGKRVCYNDKLYKILQPHTSHEAYPPDITISLYAEVLIPNPSIIPEWVQPISTNAYMTGDKVTHNGKVWISIVDNNVWEPGVYGWDEVGGDS